MADYEKRFAARHKVFDTTFRQIVDALPLPQRGRVLDVGCGDGYFLKHFMARPEQIHIVGLDPCESLAESAASACGAPRGLSFVRAVAESIPCQEGSVDLVWSAHSMQSYGDINAALREIHFILKPGGTIAVLENDCLHARLLPVPPHLELALFTHDVEETHDRAKMGLFYSRWSDRALDGAGFTDLRRKTYALERQTPWDDETQYLYELLLEDALDRSRASLEGELLEEAHDLLDPSSPHYLGLREPRFFSEFHTLFVGRKV